MRVGITTSLLISGLIVASGCGSHWTLRAEDKGKLPTGCVLKQFHVDLDGDGWGAPGSNFQDLCEADDASGFTASNDLDCDDDDEFVTGKTASICPENLLAGDLTVTATGIGDSEYVAVHGLDTPPTRYTEAARACDDWAGQVPNYERDANGVIVTDDAGLPVVDPYDAGGLATFDQDEDISTLEGWLTDQVKFDTYYAAWVGIGWKANDNGKAGTDFGTVCEVDRSTKRCADGGDRGGVWGWVDDSPQELVGDYFDFCSGGVNGPEVAEFWPELNKHDPEHRERMEAEIPSIRLALIYQGESNAEWCLGLPHQATDSTDSIYDRRSAHMVCEREAPNPEDYIRLTGDE